MIKKLSITFIFIAIVFNAIICYKITCEESRYKFIERKEIEINTKISNKIKNKECSEDFLVNLNSNLLEETENLKFVARSYRKFLITLSVANALLLGVALYFLVLHKRS